ncbi:putative nucleotidyltransferase [Chitinophaga skermanii]|uniref:Putative nucleotidyltransferase n=1 Tax=Chitinophaga skermanii TaxID=331697 RepID=A0A327Q4S3_9BACT|nr:hypothetical protein [Chitinophaga skermanii]RAI99438.1 putative nucleotidyltransferase [Chitinophaga skermanii]
MIHDILTPEILDLLGDLETILEKRNIPYYIVGAVARDINFAQATKKPMRKTNDVDIAVMLGSEEEFQSLKQELIASTLFNAHPTELIKFIYKESIEVDILPFGGIENNDETIITQPRVFALNVPGFKEILPNVNEYTTSKGKKLNVCPLEGIILLKIIANNDRPGRIKDITDIEDIITSYLDLKGYDIYQKDSDVLDFYDTSENEYLQLVNARIIGRQISRILNNNSHLRKRILTILDNKRSVKYWPEIAAGIRDMNILDE